MSPRYGALGATFQLSRLFQACSLIAIIGMTAKFISVIINNNAAPPNILIGTISVVSTSPLLSNPHIHNYFLPSPNPSPRNLKLTNNPNPQTCIAAIYCIITAILYTDDILPFLACAVLDTLLLIALIVVAIIVGKPLSYLKCTTLAELGDKDATSYAFASRLSSYIASVSGKIDYVSWIGASKAICIETKAIWGLSIGLW